MARFVLVYGEGLREYDLGHVLTGDRFGHFLDLFGKILGDRPDFEIIAPDYATDDELRLVHSQAYIDRVGSGEGLDPHDTPLTPGLVRAARLLAGAGRLAGECVQSGRAEKAFVAGGGVQHARREREKGFGIFSDVGVCVENLRRNFGLERILILDTDAHAGDGVYEIFARDASVLYISLHQDPLTLYPGRGFADEIGEGPGTGYSVNIPLPPLSDDDVYVHALERIFTPLAEAFRPEIILLIDGSDPHFSDRITRMGLGLEGIRRIGDLVGRTAKKLCRGKVVDFIGSGYSRNRDVVTLGWLASIAGLSGLDVELEEPEPRPPVPAQTRITAEEVVGRVRARLGRYWPGLKD